jgi:glutamyl-tRNA reductase
MLICLSVSYKNTSLPMLESLNISDDAALLLSVCEENIAKECILLQTCHRVEIYSTLQDINKEEAINRITRIWSTKTGVSLDLINRETIVYHGKDALMHLFYLASGLESMVLGEDQILGQVRAAFHRAKDTGTAGLILSRTFMKAINIGRRIRTETKINEGPVSISSAAVDLAAKELGNLASIKALIIGAGEAGSLAAEALKSHGTSEILIANRTYKKGLILAKKVSGRAIKFNSINSTLSKVDLVIGAISVTHPILSEKQLSSIFVGKPQKRILFIDISQPRAIEEKVGSLPRFCLKTIDDLKETIAENMRNREIEAEKSKKIISKELLRFERDLSKLVAQPLIIEICRKFEEIRKRELERAIRKMGEIDERKLAIIDRFSRELVERVAQIPIEQLRNAALNRNGELLSVAEQLFQTRS